MHSKQLKNSKITHYSSSLSSFANLRCYLFTFFMFSQRPLVQFNEIWLKAVKSIKVFMSDGQRLCESDMITKLWATVKLIKTQKCHSEFSEQIRPRPLTKCIASKIHWHSRSTSFRKVRLHNIAKLFFFKYGRLFQNICINLLQSAHKKGFNCSQMKCQVIF